jgi:hypothetical protein
MKTSKEKIVIYLDQGHTVADILTMLREQGASESDYNNIKIKMDYVGCCGGHGEGEYCYCPSSYTDIRFVWSK